MEFEDISTEEFSDVSQDREEFSKPNTEQNEQILELKNKLKMLENDTAPELIKKYKRLDNKAATERKMLYAYKDFLRQSVNYEYQTDLNEAKAELEGKREELRVKFLAELEEKKRALELERTQIDLCGNWIDSFENKTKRRLRPREIKDDREDSQNSSLTQNGGLSWLKKPPRSVVGPPDKRKRLCPGLNTLLSESEINDDLKLIKSTSRKRTSNQNNVLPLKDIRVVDGKIKIGLKWFYRHEVVTLLSRDAEKETVKISAITDKDVEVKRSNGNLSRISLGKLAREKFKFVKNEKRLVP